MIIKASRKAAVVMQKQPTIHIIIKLLKEVYYPLPLLNSSILICNLNCSSLITETYLSKSFPLLTSPFS
jgi:hypothetical protein